MARLSEHCFLENNEELEIGKRVCETPQMHSRSGSYSEFPGFQIDFLLQQDVII
jgi:hypothetical protein